MNPQCFIQRIIERGAVVPKFLPQRLFGLGLVKMGPRRTGMTPFQLWGRDDDVRRGQDSARR
jgi:hypothetical protein